LVSSQTKGQELLPNLNQGLQSNNTGRIAEGGLETDKCASRDYARASKVSIPL